MMKKIVLSALSILLIAVFAAFAAIADGGTAAGLDVAPFLGSTIDELRKASGEELPEIAEDYFLAEGHLGVLRQEGRIVYFTLPMGDTDGRYTVLGLHPGMLQGDVGAKLTDWGWIVDKEGYWQAPDADVRIFIMAEQDLVISLTYSVRSF